MKCIALAAGVLFMSMSATAADPASAPGWVKIEVINGGNTVATATLPSKSMNIAVDHGVVKLDYDDGSHITFAGDLVNLTTSDGTQISAPRN